MSNYVTLSERIEELVRQHGSLRAAARVTEIDPGYLSRLRSGEKTSPEKEKLRRLNLRRVVLYERIGRLRAERAAAIFACNRETSARLEVEAERDALQADAEQYRLALHDIAEEWAGAECGEPVYAQEAYAIALAKRMYSLAAEALSKAEAA